MGIFGGNRASSSSNQSSSNSSISGGINGDNLGFSVVGEEVFVSSDDNSVENNFTDQSYTDNSNTFTDQSFTDNSNTFTDNSDNSQVFTDNSDNSTTIHQSVDGGSLLLAENVVNRSLQSLDNSVNQQARIADSALGHVNAASARESQTAQLALMENRQLQESFANQLSGAFDVFAASTERLSIENLQTVERATDSALAVAQSAATNDNVEATTTVIQSISLAAAAIGVAIAMRG